jgi:hypothetical protein
MHRHRSALSEAQASRPVNTFSFCPYPPPGLGQAEWRQMLTVNFQLWPYRVRACCYCGLAECGISSILVFASIWIRKRPAALANCFHRSFARLPIKPQGDLHSFTTIPIASTSSRAAPSLAPVNAIAHSQPRTQKLTTLLELSSHSGSHLNLIE